MSALNFYKKAVSKIKDGINFLACDLYYTGGYSTLVGIGNALGSEKMSDAPGNFIEGFYNNTLLGLFVNAAYPLVINRVDKSKHLRLISHALNFTLNTGFLAWHYYSGTQNPISSCLPCYALGAALTEGHVRKILKDQKKLSEILEEGRKDSDPEKRIIPVYIGEESLDNLAAIGEGALASNKIRETTAVSSTFLDDIIVLEASGDN
jgi:hypothetical protein